MHLRAIMAFEIAERTQAVTEQVDAIVIGMGPGGEHVAGELAAAGLSVVGIEASLVGGECPYWGCIPSKMMIRAGNAIAEGRRVSHLAGSADIRPSWEPVAKRIRDEATDDWDDRVAVERFESKGGVLVRGKAQFAGPDTVVVGDRQFRAHRAVVIATGSAPFIPQIAGLATTPYWTNHDAIEAKDLPNSLAILGGGPIGVELGQVFARFGVDVTMIEGASRLLRNEEPESSALIQKVFESEGINVCTGSAANEVRHNGERFSVELQNGTVVNTERLLVAVGRSSNLTSLGIEHVGADPAARMLSVDENLRVAHNVWAVGDVTGKGGFTHVAMYQARIAIADILGKPHAPARYHALPRVTFTDPEIGSAGLTESVAREQLTSVAVAQTPLQDSSRGWIHKSGNEGLIKLVADAGRGVLVGATSAGPAGGEVLSMLTLAIHEATPVSRLREMIYAYPTFHRAIETALAELDL